MTCHARALGAQRRPDVSPPNKGRGGRRSRGARSVLGRGKDSRNSVPFAAVLGPSCIILDEWFCSACAMLVGSARSVPNLSRSCDSFLRCCNSLVMRAIWSEKARRCVKHLLSMGMRDVDTCILSILCLYGDGAGLSPESPWSCITLSGATVWAPRVQPFATWWSLGSPVGE